MKCDLHVHTYYSYDSTSLPKEIIEAAFKKGIDCLAITDHDKVKGVMEAEEYARDKAIVIIPGIEIKSREGDILGLNIRDIIPSRLPALETMKRIKAKGGLVVIPHSFGWSCSFKKDLRDLLSEIDAIEVFNASLFGSGNKKALEFAKKYDMPFTAGSDAHFPNFIGRAYLEIPGKDLSLQDILEGIMEKSGKIGTEKISFLEKVIDHSRRNMAKVFSRRP
jgi:predicted metal-dependent phosphoesterase TrpH